MLNPKYELAFLPIERENQHKDEDHEARNCLLELRIAPFTARFETYVRMLVALQTRQLLEKRIGAMRPLPLAPSTAQAVETPSSTQDSSDEAALQLEAARRVVQSSAEVDAVFPDPEERVSAIDDVTKKLKGLVTRQPHEDALLPEIVAELVPALTHVGVEIGQKLVDFCSQLNTTDELWLQAKYRERPLWPSPSSKSSRRRPSWSRLLHAFCLSSNS